MPDIKNRPPEFSGRLKAFCLEYRTATRNTWTLINELQTENRALIKGFYAYMVRYTSLKETRLNINKSLANCYCSSMMNGINIIYST